MLTKPIGISRLAPLLSILFVGCWSAGFIGSKLGTAYAPFDTVLMWRSLVLTIVLGPWLVAALRQRSWRELARESVVGLLSQWAYLVSVYWAIGLGVGTGTTALIDGIQPLVVAVLAGPLLGTVASARQWLGLGVGLLGIVLVTGADLFSPATTAPSWAYLVPLAGMAALVAATLVTSRATCRTPPLQALAVHCAVTAVASTALAVSRGHGEASTERGFWLAVAWMVVLATLGGYGLYWVLLDLRGPTRLNSLMFLVPPVTALWGAAWFEEPLGPVTLLGLGLGLLAVRLAGGRPPGSDAAEPVSRERDHQPA